MKYIIQPVAKKKDGSVAYVKTRSEENPFNEDYYDKEEDVIVIRASIDDAPKSILLGDDKENIIGEYEPSEKEGIYSRIK